MRAPRSREEIEKDLDRLRAEACGDEEQVRDSAQTALVSIPVELLLDIRDSLGRIEETLDTRFPTHD